MGLDFSFQLPVAAGGVGDITYTIPSLRHHYPGLAHPGRVAKWLGIRWQHPDDNRATGGRREIPGHLHRDGHGRDRAPSYH